MSNQDDFYRKFSYNYKGSTFFGTSILLPFISGVLSTILILSIAFGVPSIKEKLIGSPEAVPTTTVSDTTPISNLGNLEQVSLSSYTDTAVFAANAVLPSIVGISVEYNISSHYQTSTGNAEGSGIIISEDGYILTNNHIVNSEDSSYFYEVSSATSVKVSLYNDDTKYEAEIIGMDPETDLAVIKIDKKGLTPAKFGDSASIKIGEFVLAIGNPLGMQSSVTSGIISAINRSITSIDGTNYVTLQTDAAINAGNSGGALVNSQGEVIGLNTLKMAGSGIEGMGFAIPINSTIDIYTQLISNGKVLRPYIGISGVDLDAESAKQYNVPIGIYIKSIDENSSAQEARAKSRWCNHSHRR